MTPQEELEITAIRQAVELATGGDGKSLASVLINIYEKQAEILMLVAKTQTSMRALAWVWPVILVLASALVTLSVKMHDREVAALDKRVERIENSLWRKP